MARTLISYVKSVFESGDRPSQQDFEDLIDTTAGQATDLGTSGNNESTINGIESATVIDSFDAATWRLVKYMVSLSKTSNGDNKFYATEFSVLIDGSNINISEFGTIDNDGNMGTISITESGGTVSLTVTPDDNIKPITARFARIGLKS